MRVQTAIVVGIFRRIHSRLVANMHDICRFYAGLMLRMGVVADWNMQATPFGLRVFPISRPAFFNWQIDGLVLVPVSSKGHAQNDLSSRVRLSVAIGCS
ncbi:hypothetical protein D3C76_1156730 [compost metagenome]